MDERIRCSVDNCHYWTQGNICRASQIIVTSDAIVDSGVDIYESPASSITVSTPADTSIETCCQTFIAKGAPHARQDRVTHKGWN
ncbi:MAG: DUF1540 domain-containing protein [Limnochordia bacterium]|jgi:hypothetical protein|nr:DUF1540 domain-containing protein [Limnochordia bacterium]MDD2630173.1 DUF1540 domain-containing protein [Limnochordia bacterium]MDD4518263.1 DUF1540 domain-containing protein [Limnochordia bacterium]